MKKVTIYTTPTCGYCKMAKDFFKTKGVAYEEVDVVKDVAGRQALESKIGRITGVPIITVDEEAMVGFDEAHLASILGV
jgi:glutaredoxin-like YruB-family protein